MQETVSHLRFPLQKTPQLFHTHLLLQLKEHIRWNPSEWPLLKMKAIEQYFHAVLFIMLYKVVLTFKSVDETLVCDHSNESYWAVLSCGIVFYPVQGGSNFYSHVRLWRKP